MPIPTISVWLIGGCPIIIGKVNDFTNMLKDVREKVSQMIKSEKSLEEIIASQPTSKYDEIYYDHTSRQPEDIVTFIYQSLEK